MKATIIIKGFLHMLKKKSENEKGLSLKTLLLIVIGLLTIGSTVYMLVGKTSPRTDTVLIQKLDSLHAVTIKLQEDAQKILDREVELNNSLDKLQTEVDSLHGMRFIVRKYIHVKAEAARGYEAKQVDSFLKDRYNY